MLINFLESETGMRQFKSLPNPSSKSGSKLWKWNPEKLSMKSMSRTHRL